MGGLVLSGINPPFLFHFLRVIVMAIAGVAVGVATYAYNNLNQNPNDNERFNKAEQWYNRAKAGDADALCALKHMSGRFGETTCGVNGPASGFATQVAKDYSYGLYLAVTQNMQPPPRPQPGSRVDLSRFGSVLGQASSVTGSVSNQLGFPNQQQQALNLVLIGLAVLAVVFLIKKVA